MADSFKQIRSAREEYRPWSRSVEDVLLQSPATLTSVFISSFEAHPHSVDRFLKLLLPQSCPILKDITVVADYRQSGEGIRTLGHNPNVATTADDRVTVIFPEVPESHGRRLKHGIQHTKIMLLRHAAGGHQQQRGWLQIVVASCNLSSWQHPGDVLWMSPRLPAVDYDISRVLPMTSIGRRVGHTLFRTISQTVAAVKGVEGDPSTDKREWARMLAGYALEAIPRDTWFVASLPGNHAHDAAPVHAHARALQRTAAANDEQLGEIASPLMGWNKDRAMGQPLRQWWLEHLGAGGEVDEVAAGAAFGTVIRDVELTCEPDNVADPNAVSVHLPRANGGAGLGAKVGYLKKESAKVLSSFVRSGELKFSVLLKAFDKRRKVEAAAKRDGADEGGAAAGVSSSSSSSSSSSHQNRGLREHEINEWPSQDWCRTTTWQIEIVVSRNAPADGGGGGGRGGALGAVGAAFSAAFSAASAGARRAAGLGADRVEAVRWSELVDLLHCRMGLSRLREILGTSEWDLREQTNFRSYSPCLGRAGFDRWLYSFVSAVDGVEDLNSIPKKTVVQRLREAGAFDSSVMKGAKVEELRAELRHALAPGQQLPMLVVPARVCADYLMDREAFFSLDKARCLVDVGAQPDEMAAVRQKAGYHAKMIHRSFRNKDTGAPYGWTYVGSHNLSATAWGLPFGDGRLLQCASYELGVVMLVPKGTPVNDAQERLSFESLPFQFRLDDPPFDEYERQAAEESYDVASQREAKFANHGVDAGEWEHVGRTNSQDYEEQGQWTTEGQGGHASNGIMMDDGYGGFGDDMMSDGPGFQRGAEGKQPLRPGAAAALAAAKESNANDAVGESLSQDVEFQTALALSASEAPTLEEDAPLSQNEAYQLAVKESLESYRRRNRQRREARRASIISIASSEPSASQDALPASRSPFKSAHGSSQSLSQYTFEDVRASQDPDVQQQILDSFQQHETELEFMDEAEEEQMAATQAWAEYEEEEQEEGEEEARLFLPGDYQHYVATQELDSGDGQSAATTDADADADADAHADADARTSAGSEGGISEKWKRTLMSLVEETRRIDTELRGKRRREQDEVREMDTLALLRKVCKDGPRFLETAKANRECFLRPAKVAKKMGHNFSPTDLLDDTIVGKIWGVLKHIGWTDVVEPPHLHLLKDVSGTDPNNLLAKHQVLLEVVKRLQEKG